MFIPILKYIVLLPPIVTIALSIILGRPALSMVIGICLGVLIQVNDFSYSLIIKLITHFSNAFYQDNFIWNNIFLVTFLWLLGVLTTILLESGSLDTFSNIILKKFQTQKRVDTCIIYLGFLIFIDDFFSSLTVGTIGKSIVDKIGTSREKLAYILDSTSGPVSIIVPFSSWGATILVILNTSLSKSNYHSINPFSLFLFAIPFNFYVWFTFIIMIISVRCNYHFPLMAKYEKNAKLYSVESNPSTSSRKAYSDEYLLNTTLNSFLLLVISSFLSMILSGTFNTDLSKDSLMSTFNNMEVGLSLFIGVSFSILFVLIKLKNLYSLRKLQKSFKEGYVKMADAIKILTLAWALASVVQQLEVGALMTNLINSLNFDAVYIPIIIFFLAGIVSFSTGTSWATFSILIPIVCQITDGQTVELLTISIGSVLGGSIFGDHCSPISDTSILASTGAECEHMNHVRSQLPYGLLAALFSSITFYIVGLIFIKP